MGGSMGFLSHGGLGGFLKISTMIVSIQYQVMVKCLDDLRVPRFLGHLLRVDDSCITSFKTGLDIKFWNSPFRSNWIMIWDDMRLS